MNPSMRSSEMLEKSGVGKGVAATFTGRSTLDAREASDASCDTGSGIFARAVRSSISSGLDLGDGVQISGSGLEVTLEPAPL